MAFLYNFMQNVYETFKTDTERHTCCFIILSVYITRKLLKLSFKANRKQ